MTDDETKDTDPQGVEFTITKPSTPLPCVACGVGVPPQRLCDPCDTKRQTARDRIWFAGVAMQEVMRQDATITPRQHQTWSEIAEVSFTMAELMLAKAKRT